MDSAFSFSEKDSAVIFLGPISKGSAVWNALVRFGPARAEWRVGRVILPAGTVPVGSGMSTKCYTRTVGIVRVKILIHRCTTKYSLCLKKNVNLVFRRVKLF